MRILIVEDDFASRKFMMNFMSAYGDCDGTVDVGVAAGVGVTSTTDPFEPHPARARIIVIPRTAMICFAFIISILSGPCETVDTFSCL